MVTHALLPSRRSIPIRITLACYMRAGTAVGGRTRGQPCRLRVVSWIVLCGVCCVRACARAGVCVCVRVCVCVCVSV